MSVAPVRVLLLEDDTDDAELLRQALAQSEAYEFAVTRVGLLADALAAVATGEIDIVLSDLGLPDSEGPATVHAITARAPELPLVVLTGQDDAELGREAIRLGAQDYLIKGKTGGELLARALRYAMQRKRLESGLRTANDALARRVAERTAELEAANAVLRANAARDQAMMQSAGAGIVTIDAAARILNWNAAASGMFGYVETDAIGHPLTMLIPQRYRERLRIALEGVLDGSEQYPVGKTVELEGLTREGREFPIEVSISEWRVPEGRFFTGIVRDVSERKRAEAALARQRDLYDALSRTNEAIARSADPDELFEHVCRIAVEHGHFLFVWIGLHDECTPWLKVVGKWGVDGGYFDRRRAIMARSGARSSGLARRAVATGRHVVANDFLNQPEAKLWHEAARQRGVRAFAAFPIRQVGQVIGSINVYAGETGIFTDDVVATLDSMALDLSHALDSLQRETQRRRAEEALRESEEVFRRLFEEAPIGIAMVDIVNKRYLRANSSLCSMLGYTEDELKRLTFLDTTHPDDRGKDLDATARRRSGLLGQYRTEKRYLNKRGDTIWARASVSFINSESAEPLYTVVMVEDITEQRRAQDSLRDSEERYRELFRSSRDAILLMVPDGSVLEVNPAACSMFGRSEDELQGGGAALLVAASDRPLARAPVPRWCSGPYVGELDFQRGNGTTFPGEVTTSVFVSKDGKKRSRVQIRDLSKRRRMEEALREFPREIIAAQEEERRRVSAALHHDAGSFAVGISAHLDAIEADLRSGKSGDARKTVQRTRKIFKTAIGRLKDLAVQLRPVELDILGLRAALRQHFASVSRRGGVRIQFTEAMGRRSVPADASTILFRVAQEALTNAITHGGATQVRVRLGSSSQTISLSIRDNGKGFDATAIPKKATPRMGLRVMREMTTSAAGEFSVQSSPGKGTLVSVRLPRAGASLGAVEPRQDKAVTGARSSTATRSARARQKARA